MSSQTDTTPLLPRKKPNILWWLGGFFLLLVCLFLWQIFGPDPPIIVSRQTTYITTPLRTDGLPDYERYILELYRKGVTPENNAAVLLWQALWPGELDPKHYALVAEELRLEEIPPEEDSLVPLHDTRIRSRVETWLVQQVASQSADSGAIALTDEANEQRMSARLTLDELIDQTMSAPWTSNHIPPLASWLHENQAPLDLIVEASRRPRYYSPSPTLLDQSHEGLYTMMLPDIQAVRGAARSLAARAMWHLGEGRSDEAWEDLLAMHRLGRLVAQGHTMVEKLVGIAIDGMACRGTAALLHDGTLSTEQLEMVRRDLNELSNFNSMGDSINGLERAGFLDAVIGLGPRNSKASLDALSIDHQSNYMNVLAIDWNVVLRTGNDLFDRLAKAMRMPPGQKRRQALQQVEGEVERIVGESRQPGDLVASVFSRGARSQLVASMMIGLLLPANSAAISAEDRANTNLELTRLAAALALYRSAHGAYPEKLDDLLPGLIDAVPTDLYNAKPFLYKRTEDGFLLYSAGENGIDDGGSNEHQSLFEGRSLEDIEGAEMTDAEEVPYQIPPGADDISIRVPGPSLELPKPPPTN